MKKQDFNLEQFLRSVSMQPGVYQMFDRAGAYLYIGKAKNLKQRLLSYGRTSHQSYKTKVLMQLVANIEVILTDDEHDALLLENNLIKAHQPRFNVLLRDDKSYLYLYLTRERFPRLMVCRQKNRPQQTKQRYFGPYAHVKTVRDTQELLQRLFRLRSCNPSVFSHRLRPCLEYQLGRCSAPCVNLINYENYQHFINYVRWFLEGKRNDIVEDLSQRMQEASDTLDYEKAMVWRDQIYHLRQLQRTSAVEVEQGNEDIVVVADRCGVVCLYIASIRGGCMIHSRSYFYPLEGCSDHLLDSLSQHYLNIPLDGQRPERVMVQKDFPEQDWLAAALSREWNYPLRITSHVRKNMKACFDLAVKNAQYALDRYLLKRERWRKQWNGLTEWLELTLRRDSPEADDLCSRGLHRIECFDASHTQGSLTVVSCVALGPEGPLKHHYRRFNIDGVQPGDDCAALEQALVRRYITSEKNAQLPWPDIILIDGGRGQLHRAQRVLQGKQPPTVLLAISKGEGRRPGLETLWYGKPAHSIAPPDGEVFHLLQYMRDEAHRFALQAHRSRREKRQLDSVLEQIPGIGPQRRRLLLQHFGGIQGIVQATIEQLLEVPGMHRILAERLYQSIHGEA